MPLPSVRARQLVLALLLTLVIYAGVGTAITSLGRLDAGRAVVAFGALAAASWLGILVFLLYGRSRGSGRSGCVKRYAVASTILVGLFLSAGTFAVIYLRVLPPGSSASARG